MTGKELRRLSKTDLLSILRDQQAEIETLHTEREALNGQLEKRAVTLEQCGSIAEASLALNGVFQAAQQAADQYLASVHAREADTERRLRERMEQTERECQKRLIDTQKQCDELELSARKSAEQYWSKLSQRLETLYESHQGLQEMISAAGLELSLPTPTALRGENHQEKDEVANETAVCGAPDTGAVGAGA